MGTALLMVDPQYDFIAGTLPVPGAAAAMDALAQYVLVQNGAYALKIVTQDWHPWDHSSFVPSGGAWPRHCVANSVGAAIFEPLFQSIHRTGGDVVVLHKGCSPEEDEYSAFQSNGDVIDSLWRQYGIDTVHICGVAGDVCVLQTLQDGLKRNPGIHWEALKAYAPSLDGGDKLDKFCQEAGLCSK